MEQYPALVPMAAFGCLVIFVGIVCFALWKTGKLEKFIADTKNLFSKFMGIFKR